MTILVLAFYYTVMTVNSLVFHTGAYIGAYSLGVNYQITPYYALDAAIGYVPQRVGGEDLWSFSLKNRFALMHGKHFPYLGIGMVYSFDRDNYIVLPDQYPRGYYPPTALHFFPYAGININISKIESVYMEAAVLDYYLELKARNYEHVTWDDITTWGIGYRYRL